jgi:hypothetical protein
MSLGIRARVARHSARHGEALPSKPQVLNGAQVDRLLGTRRTEQRIQKAIIEHLTWRARLGAFAFHYPAGGWRTRAEAGILKAIGTVAGIPDILVIYRGQLFCLELKTERGRLTEVQHTTHERLREAGATVATAYGLDAALAQLEAWDLLRTNTTRRSQNSRPRLPGPVSRHLAAQEKRS